MSLLCETCFRPAKWLVQTSAMVGWPLYRRTCGYHKGDEAIPLTAESLAMKERCDAEYRASFGTKCHSRREVP